MNKFDNLNDLKNIDQEKQQKIIHFDEFLKFSENISDELLTQRMIQQSPAKACTLVYTSGTTGHPKGCILTQDNCIYGCQVVCQDFYPELLTIQQRIATFLPLSHVASQQADLILSHMAGAEIYITDSSALQGSLINYLKEIRPTVFFSVPRLWEKIEDKMKLMGSQNNWLKQQVAGYAKSIGAQQTLSDYKPEKDAPFLGNFFKTVIFNKIKQELGLDKTIFCIFGGGPMQLSTRKYFLSLNFYLINAYGMSESSGVQTAARPETWQQFDDNCLKSCGQSLPGTETVINNQDQNGEGEICYKGRNRFAGYYMNEKATKEHINENGFLKSGDLGRRDKDGNIYITGRSKELIITAGGENVAPLILEDNIKQRLNIISNAVVIGDQKKYLTVLLTFKHVADINGNPTDEFNEVTLNALKDINSTSKNIQDARKDEKIQNLIKQAIEETNQVAISNAQKIQKYYILDRDFSVDGGELTPTMKLKRKIIHRKNEKIINSLYLDPKL